MEPKDVMTLRDVAEYLQLGVRSVYRLLRDGDLPGHKVLGRWRFHRGDVDHWLRAPDRDPVGDSSSPSGSEASSVSTSNERTS